MRLAEPDGPALRAVAADEPRLVQEPVDHAELRVVHPLPGEHADRDGQRERDDDERAHELFPLEALEQEEGEARTQNALEDGRHHQEHDAVAEGVPEGVHLPGGAEVAEADELRHLVTDAGIAQGEVERKQEGDADEEQDVEGGGGQQQVAERQATTGVRVPPRAGAATPRGRLGGGASRRPRAVTQYRHARLCLAKIRRYSPTPHFTASSTDVPRATRVKMSGRTNWRATSWIWGV